MQSLSGKWCRKNSDENLQLGKDKASQMGGG